MSSSTRRCTRRRRRPHGVGLTALALAGVLLSGCAGTGERVFSGDYSPTEPISILNRTIGDGQYLISYSLRVFVAPQSAPVDVTCTIIDTSGRIAFFADLEQTVPSGTWTTIAAEGEFDLPELTLGLRCRPVVPTTMSLIVRDVRLDVESH